MKKVVIATILIAFISTPFCLHAQEDKTVKKEKQETEEIVIRNKDGKDLNLKVEINGDKIMVNGLPLAEFKNDKITINKRKIIIRDGDEMMAFDFRTDGMNFNEDFMKQLKNGKQIIKPFLGVTTEGVAGGAKIIEIIKESAAEKAGLKKDDIITKIDDEIIKDGEILSQVISTKKSNDVVRVSYLRNGKSGSVKATLGENKINSSMAFAFKNPRYNVRSFRAPGVARIPKKGMLLEDRLNDMDAESLAPLAGFDEAPYMQLLNSFPRQKKLGLKIQDTEDGGNVKVIDVEEGSAAEKAGLKKEDIITEIGGVKIENTDDARKQLLPSETKTAYTIKAKRAGIEMSFDVKFPKKLKTADL